MARFLCLLQYNGCLKHATNKEHRQRTSMTKPMGIKPGPKRFAISTG